METAIHAADTIAGDEGYEATKTVNKLMGVDIEDILDDDD